MTDRTAKDVMNALDDLLEEERGALLRGDLEVVERLLAQKEQLIEELSVLDHAEYEDLHALVDKVSRNQDLLQHAMEGIRTVADRLAEMRRLKTKLDTYDAQGAKYEIEIEQTGTLEKRA